MCWLLNTAETDQFSWRPLVKELVTFNSAARLSPSSLQGIPQVFCLMRTHWFDPQPFWSSLPNRIRTNQEIFSWFITVRISWCLQNTQMQGLGLWFLTNFYKAKVFNCWASFMTDSDQILPGEQEQSGGRWSKALCPSHSEHKEKGETILSV